MFVRGFVGLVLTLGSLGEGAGVTVVGLGVAGAGVAGEVPMFGTIGILGACGMFARIPIPPGDPP